MQTSRSPAQEWDFDTLNDLHGWTVTKGIRGVVMGGSVWMNVSPIESDPLKITTTGYQVVGDAQGPLGKGDRWFEPLRELLISPRGLAVPPASAGRQLQVHLRLINLSPVTDMFIEWRGAGEPGAGQPDKFAGSKRCTLKSDIKEWQSITCYISSDWKNPIDQIAVAIPINVLRGDIWISHIDVVSGDPQPTRPRPDLFSEKVVPRIHVPGITQAQFADAFRVLDECLIVDVPLYGFTYPVLTPDGHGATYGESWWEEDGSVGIAGAKWANESFAENDMRGFHDLQANDPDGRFDSFGWAAVHGQPADESQSPQYFEVAYDVARRTSDSALRSEILETMQKYLDWWFSPVKRDHKTGLITGEGEESFGQVEDFSIQPQIWAPIDLNVGVATGAALTAKLAALLHRNDLAARDEQSFRNLSQAINTYLWDEKDGVYHEYDLRKGERFPRLFVSIFSPLRLGIAPPARRDRLIQRLLDPAQFNWGKAVLPTLAMTDPEFKSTTLTQTPASPYNWTGDVWSVTTVPVIFGLRDSGREDLAAELNWGLVKEFNGNYRETLLPQTGQGIGALRYAESASQYIQGVIENLFGIDFDAAQKRVRIRPLVPKELYGKKIALENVILPGENNSRLSVQIEQTSASAASVIVDASGSLPDVTLEVSIPSTATPRTSPLAAHTVVSIP